MLIPLWPFILAVVALFWPLSAFIAGLLEILFFIGVI